MKTPLIAIPSFPGSNGEVDNLKMLRRIGCDAFVFRWNDSFEKLAEVDGYFFGAGFSYEDRGRSGMVAARDPLFDFMRNEAEKGKVIIGNCNGAQVLIESGLVPLGDDLRMCLAHNARSSADGSWQAPGFLNEWVWMKPMCAANRCVTSNWTGVMHTPIAHGEGRFVTKDPDLIAELKKNDQIAFCYCDEQGNVSADAPITPNGSSFGIAGICNTRGNVVAIMPHPERTPLGDPYFLSMKQWIETHGRTPFSPSQSGNNAVTGALATRTPMIQEIFIATIITNNEERTVEQAARRIAPTLSLRQFRYVGLQDTRAKDLLSNLSFFNPQKEIAFIREGGKISKWNAEKKMAFPLEKNLFAGITLLRRDEPDMLGNSLQNGAQTGVCYDCVSVTEDALFHPKLLAVFGNPHASIIERFSV